MGNFLGYLLEQHVIEKDRYIASLEFGTELRSGTGEFVLSAYEITVPAPEDGSAAVYGKPLLVNRS